MLSRAPDHRKVARGRGARILIVDDEPFNVDLLDQEIEEYGHVGVAATDGIEALAMIEGETWDLVLLDITMPRMDGIEVLERLNAQGRLADLPVIVVSAVDDMQSVARCIELGAEDHLIKPFDPTLLRARIEGALEKKRLRDQVAQQLAITRKLFGRYVPPSVAEDILSGQGSLEPVERIATILYSDIAGFTRTVQDMSPAGTLALLNAFYEAVIVPLSRHGGVVNEFVGDGMLVTFNLPTEAADHADRAVAAALDIHKVLAGRRFAGQELAVRIGVHSGPVVAGNVIAGDRLHYTVLGDTVNVAARLQEANKRYGTSILISGTTARMLTRDDRLERLDNVRIRGRDDPIDVYAHAADTGRAPAA